jgi:hypothetical protein
MALRARSTPAPFLTLKPTPRREPRYVGGPAVQYCDDLAARTCALCVLRQRSAHLMIRPPNKQPAACVCLKCVRLLATPVEMVRFIRRRRIWRNEVRRQSAARSYLKVPLFDAVEGDSTIKADPRRPGIQVRSSCNTAIATERPVRRTADCVDCVAENTDGVSEDPHWPSVSLQRDDLLAVSLLSAIEVNRLGAKRLYRRFLTLLTSRVNQNLSEPLIEIGDRYAASRRHCA